jgi:hypothetical protein
MNPVFRELTERLDAKCQALLAMQPFVAESVPAHTPQGGIYLFSDGEIPLYVGRTKRKIGTRIKNHFGAAPDCPFAWRLARERTGHIRATYRAEGSRRSLLANPEFRKAYEEAKQRIRKMHVRFVEEADPLRQTLLEIYVAVVSGAKHNDFDTH